MSQFFGFIGLSKGIDVQAISQKMQESLAFFTPERQGIYETNEVFIVQKHLFNSIESLNAPAICQTNRYVLAGSCRVDNREELFQKLKLHGTAFGKESISDLEVILASFEKYGSDCVQHLMGDFAFVVWDKQDQKLFMAKDHLGIKPLFYLKSLDFLIFSTSVTGIKAAFDKVLPINELYVAYNLKNFSPPVRLTFFEDIHRLAPAHFCEFSKQEGGLVETKYWELNTINISQFETDAERLAELRKLLEQAVQCRTRTTKNIGCQLSGGLDSSAITVLASRLLDKNRLHTYSFVLNDKTRAYSEIGIDEQNTQNEIIDFAQLKTENHHKIEDFHFEDVFDEMKYSNIIMGGYAHSDCIWQATLFKEAQKNNIGLMFSGFPGDECVSNPGWWYYYEYIYSMDLRKLWAEYRMHKLKSLKRLFKYVLAYLRGYNFIIKGIAERNFLKKKSSFNKVVKNDFGAFYPSFRKYLRAELTRPHTCLRTESEGAYALAFGLETVYPLADIRLCTFAYSLPVEMFNTTPIPRMLFRRMCEGILPDSVRLQPKNSGAKTLAFVEYWMKQHMNAFNGYQIVNRLNLSRIFTFDLNDSYKTKLWALTALKIDWFIEKNKLE